MPSVKIPLALSSEVYYDLDRTPDDAVWTLEIFVSTSSTWDVVRQMLKLVYSKVENRVLEIAL